MANLGKYPIRKIETIEREAPPEIKALAVAGDESIYLASQFVDLPPEAQQEALETIAQHEAPAKEVMSEAVTEHPRGAIDPHLAHWRQGEHHEHRNL